MSQCSRDTDSSSSLNWWSGGDDDKKPKGGGEGDAVGSENDDEAMMEEDEADEDDDGVKGAADKGKASGQKRKVRTVAEPLQTCVERRAGAEGLSWVVLVVLLLSGRGRRTGAGPR